MMCRKIRASAAITGIGSEVRYTVSAEDPQLGIAGCSFLLLALVVAGIGYAVGGIGGLWVGLIPAGVALLFFIGEWDDR